MYPLGIEDVHKGAQITQQIIGDQYKRTWFTHSLYCLVNKLCCTIKQFTVHVMGYLQFN